MAAKILRTRRNFAMARRLPLKRAKIMWIVSVGRRSIAAVVINTLTITISPHLGGWREKGSESDKGVENDWGDNSSTRQDDEISR